MSSSDPYVDQLLLTDPELVSSVDASMSRLGYRRINLSDLNPEMAEAIACRDKTIETEFRPENDRLVYEGDKNILQIRRRGSKISTYWTQHWGALLIHSTYVPDTSDFNSDDLVGLEIPHDYLKRLVEAKRAELPGIKLNVVGYESFKGTSSLDPSRAHMWFFDDHLLTNQHLSVSRKLDTNITHEEKEKIIKVLSTMLPYLTDVTTRYARSKAISVRAIKSALKQFEESITFQPINRP